MSAIAGAIAPRFDQVPFQGTEILATRIDDTIYVPMKRFCGTVGLPWDGARRRIQRDDVLREGAVMMTVPSTGGDQLQQTLPLDLIPGFLMGAEVSRFKPELQERVRTFRRTCYRVLHEHFFAPAQAAQRPSPIALLDARARGDALRLVEAIRVEHRPAVRDFLHQLLQDACAKMGVPTPSIEMIGGAPLPAVDLFQDLMSGLKTLEARGVRFNHLGGGTRGTIAINLVELGRLFAKHDIDVRFDGPMRAALRAGTARYRCRLDTVTSAIVRNPWKRRVHCHLLEVRS